METAPKLHGSTGCTGGDSRLDCRVAAVTARAFDGHGLSPRAHPRTIEGYLREHGDTERRCAQEKMDDEG